MLVTPRGESASTTAFAIAAGAPTVGDSPTPFAPIGWWGEGVVVPVSVRGLDRCRDEVVQERVAAHVPVFVVGDLLVERRREAHVEPSVDPLGLDDHRVDDRPAVIDRDEPAGP